MPCRKYLRILVTKFYSIIRITFYAEPRNILKIHDGKDLILHPEYQCRLVKGKILCGILFAQAIYSCIFNVHG